MKSLKENLIDDFKYFKNDTLNKTEYLELMNRKNSKIVGDNLKYTLIDIVETDSTVSTLEIQSTLMDSLLKAKNLLEVRKTYFFNNDKISKIIIDTVLNKEEHNKEIIELYTPFVTYVEDKYNDELKQFKKEEELQKYYSENLISLLTEYTKLSEEVKKEYKTLSYLKGTFICETSIYKKLEFKGKSTVIIYDKFIGIPFPTSYVVDEDYIRIRTDKSDLLLRIKDKTTLEGEGWAKGTFKKVE